MDVVGIEDKAVTLLAEGTSSGFGAVSTTSSGATGNFDPSSSAGFSGAIELCLEKELGKAIELCEVRLEGLKDGVIWDAVDPAMPVTRGSKSFAENG